MICFLFFRDRFQKQKQYDSVWWIWIRYAQTHRVWPWKQPGSGLFLRSEHLPSQSLFWSVHPLRSGPTGQPIFNANPKSTILGVNSRNGNLTSKAETQTTSSSKQPKEICTVQFRRSNELIETPQKNVAWDFEKWIFQYLVSAIVNSLSSWGWLKKNIKRYSNLSWNGRSSTCWGHNKFSPIVGWSCSLQIILRAHSKKPEFYLYSRLLKFLNWGQAAKKVQHETKLERTGCKRNVLHKDLWNSIIIEHNILRFQILGRWQLKTQILDPRSKTSSKETALKVLETCWECLFPGV